MDVGTQFTGQVAAGTTASWFTHSWDPAHHVVWTVIPLTVGSPGAQIEWSVQVQRASASRITYWIVVRNLSTAPVDVEGRYAILD